MQVVGSKARSHINNSNIKAKEHKIYHQNHV